MKSPLKHTKKTAKSLGTVDRLIPSTAIVHSFLFYDGVYEAFLAKKNRFIVGHTTKYVVSEFWQCLKLDARRMGEFIKFAHPIADEPMREILQKQWYSYKDPYVRSGMFFLLNHYSENGIVSSGHTDPDSFNAIHLSNLYNFSFDKFHVVHDDNDDFLEGARKIQKEEYLLFNAGSYSLNIFEEGKSAGEDETRVMHADLKDFFASTTNPCILVYEKHNELFKIYKDYNMIMIDKWGRKVDDREKCQEIVIANF
ncbi:MAG: hypothetical protein HOB02_08210 [Proteobacteria bacterium]|jgi:hypothetical protein|nr:hypothetical protein [Pseudomonadota bacterium]